MTINRLWHSFRLFIIRGSGARADYIRKNGLFNSMGMNCSFQKRKLPLYPNLIRIGNNVHIASNVSFLTHDVTCNVINGSKEILERYNGNKVKEKIGCIEIGDNVFVGSGTHILYDTKIGSNVIIGTCSVVTHDIPDNSVVAGVPAKVIGSFDEYVGRFINDDIYPDDIKPRHQKVSDELASYMWKRFDSKHSK